MNDNNTLRRRTFELLNPEHRGGRLGRSVNILLISLILANVVVICLETMAELKQAYAVEFFCFEIFSVLVFTIEYILRLWSSVENQPSTDLSSALQSGQKNQLTGARRQYVVSFESLIDLVAIVPFYISLLFGIELKALLALRLFRLLKLVRYFSALNILLDVLRAEARSFMAAILVLLILIFVSASGIYFFECEVQPEEFGSIPQALWWSTVTLTTLGYGDVVPMTVFGKTFAGMMTIFSIGIVALPAGMLASRFSEELVKRKQRYLQTVKALASDGLLDHEDHEELEQLRSDLCLSDHDAQIIRASSSQNPCPYCAGLGTRSTAVSEN
ncbi:MAG: voltage-gated potassium channel [Cryomorphaceae bacterium]|jgi:voltage-gated potassium channel